MGEYSKSYLYVGTYGRNRHIFGSYVAGMYFSTKILICGERWDCTPSLLTTYCIVRAMLYLFVATINYSGIRGSVDLKYFIFEGIIPWWYWQCQVHTLAGHEAGLQYNRSQMLWEIYLWPRDCPWASQFNAPRRFHLFIHAGIETSKMRSKPLANTVTINLLRHVSLPTKKT